MNHFLEDLWHDLREKRLWPVAVALVLALVAIPVFLKKPFEAPAPAPVASQPQDEQTLERQAKVVLADEEAGNGSQLDLFEAKDPFKGPKKETPDQGTGTAGGATSGAGGSVGSTLASAAGDAASSGGSSGGGGTAGGGFSGGGTGGGPAPNPEPKTTNYTYVIDVTFERDGRTRKEKGMTRLEMLPNASAPLLVFLGVDSRATNAVFLVDSSLKPTGEGKCQPSAKDCNFLYLGAGNEHMFTGEDGTTYMLRVDDIRKVKVKASASKASGKSRDKAKAGRPKAETSDQAPRRFVPPLLLDLVSVSSHSGGRSKDRPSGR